MAAALSYSTGRQHEPPNAVIKDHRGKAEPPDIISPIRVDHRARLSRFWAPTSQRTESHVHDKLEQTADLLTRAGYVHPTHAGIFQFLPLGNRVQNKIEKLLDKHMEKLGAAKVSLSAFSSEALWKRSGRLDGDITELFRVEDRRGSKFLLSPTHEEEITELVSGFLSSYRDLPLRLYQITRKYRDELRARAGLLRTREFLMKDLYTFDRDEKHALTTYRQVCDAYAALFAELKLPVHVAVADSGSIGGDLSHEYHLLSPMGEDDVVVCADCHWTANVEVLPARVAPDGCPTCHSERLSTHKAIELGHAFFFGTKYSVPLEANVETDPGRHRPLQMGSYGIGVSRMIAGVADVLRDTRGLNWPHAIAPFEVVVISRRNDSGADEVAVYDRVAQEGKVDVILDDRGRSIISMLKDADLIGYPVIVVLGEEWENSGHRRVELQCRRLGIKEIVGLDSLTARVNKLLAQL